MWPRLGRISDEATPQGGVVEPGGRQTCAGAAGCRVISLGRSGLDEFDHRHRHAGRRPETRGRSVPVSTSMPVSLRRDRLEGINLQQARRPLCATQPSARLFCKHQQGGARMALPRMQSRHWNFYIAVAVGLVTAAATLAFAPDLFPEVAASAFSLTYLVLTARDLPRLTPDYLRHHAGDEDAPPWVVFLLTLAILVYVTAALFLAVNDKSVNGLRLV